MKEEKGRNKMDYSKVNYQVCEHCLIIQLPKEVDDHNCQGIKVASEHIIKEKKIKEVVFDCSNTVFMDSSGIGILLGRYKRMKELGGAVYIHGESGRIKKIFKMSGVYQIIQSI